MVVVDLPIIDQEENYSIAYSSWLSGNNGITTMLYPPRNSMNKALRSKKYPERNWMKADVKIIATYDNLDEAKSKLRRLIDFDSTTTEEDARENRKSRHYANPKFADCEMWESSEGLLPNCPTLKDIDYCSTVNSQISPNRASKDDELEVTVLDLQDLQVTDQSVQTERRGNDYDLLKEILEVKNLLLSFDVRLQNIESYIRGGKKEQVVEVQLPVKLPMQDEADLKSINEKLVQNTHIFKGLVCHLKRNMGNNEKDCVYKILHACFSIDLARQCSMMGKHNNIKLDGMEIINVIRATAMENYINLTNEKFKVAVMDWFRGAELRHKRHIQKQNTV